MRKTTKSWERETKICDDVQTTDFDKSVLVEYNLNHLGEGSYFAEKNPFYALTERVGPYEAVLKTKRRFYQYSDKYWEAFNTSGASRAVDIMRDERIDPTETINNKFDEDSLVYFWCDDHLMYRMGQRNPISGPYFQDYIGGVTNKEFNLKMAYDILSKNPNVWGIEKTVIPYYNSYGGKTDAIEFFARLPQDTFDKMCDYFRDTKKNQFWSVRLKEAITYKPWIVETYSDAPFDFDFFGLKAAAIDPVDQEDCCEDDDNY